MPKFTIDYHEQSGRFFTKHGGYVFSHKTIGALVTELKDRFGRDYKGYKATRKAQRTYG